MTTAQKFHLPYASWTEHLDDSQNRAWDCERMRDGVANISTPTGKLAAACRPPSHAALAG